MIDSKPALAGCARRMISLAKPALRRRSEGFTLLEVLIALAIMVMLVTFGVPSFSSFYSGQRVIGAAEQIYNHLQQARTEAVTRNTTVYVNFTGSGSTTWSYGMSSINSGCDLTKTAATDAGACVMVVDDGDGSVYGIGGSTDTGDLVLNRFTSADYSGVTMTIASFSSGSNQFVLSATRGTSTSGTVTLSANSKSLKITMSLLGRPKICSPSGTIQGYPSC